MTKALHDKYRPQSWEEVIGQEHVLPSLQSAVTARRAHTYLFTGPSGIGKTTLARIVAKTFIGPGGNASNLEEFRAAENSGIAEVKAIVERSNRCGLGKSSARVFICDEVHRLSRQAWDSLLQATEEPPDYCFWLFCTTEVGKVPKTMLTRCLQYELKPVSEEQIAKLVAWVITSEKLKVSRDIIELIAEAANGSPRQALVYLEACAGCSSVAEARTLMKAATETPEVVQLCRFLVERRTFNWVRAMQVIRPILDVGTEPESVRIVVTNYLGVVLMKAKSDDEARQILSMLECFGTPYLPSEKAAPLLRSVGLAIGLDRA